MPWMSSEEVNTIAVVTGLISLLVFAVAKFLSAMRRPGWLTALEAGRVPVSPMRERSGVVISFDSAGFTVTDSRLRAGGSVEMKWADVHRVIAFKRDLFSYDEICLLLAGADGNGWEVSEEMEGWLPLVEALPCHLPGCKPSSEWLWPVAVPAFEANTTELFVRESPRKPEGLA